MNGKIGSLFVILILLVGFGGAGNESFELAVLDGENDTGLATDYIDLDGLDLENESFDSMKNQSVFDTRDFSWKGNDTNESLGNEENLSVNLREFARINDSVNGGVDEVKYEYVDIDELIVEEEVKVEVVLKEKVLKELVKDGLVELEFEIMEGDDIEILKKEIGRGTGRKDVVISSAEHFDDEVLVYSNLPGPAREEDIVVTWENEGEEVLDLEYFDLDSDGLIDRVSWVVPHLSTQRYSIEIVVGDGGEGEDLNIVIGGPSGVVSNPVVFDFEIYYVNSSDVECLLSIDGVGGPSFGIEGFNGEMDFENGTHSWDIYCWDINDESMSFSDSGNFIVRDLFRLEVGGFFLKNEGVSGRVETSGEEVELKLFRSGSELWFESFGESDDFNIAGPQFASSGDYLLVAVSNFYGDPVEVVKEFKVGNIALNFDADADAGEDVDFNINIDSDFLIRYDLYVGSSKVVTSLDTQTITADFSEGSYEVWLKNINGGDFDDISFGILDVASSEDTTDPDVRLIFPDWEDEVDSNDIEFEYKVDEDGGIKNCSFKLYDTKEDSSGVHQTDDLIFPLSSADKDLAFEDDIDDNERVEVRLVDFDEGDYIWEVRCVDDAGNEGWDFNYFSVVGEEVEEKSNAGNYSRQDEVLDLIDKMNEFLTMEDSFGIEERKVLDVLGLSKDMSFWKKRLVQMDQDLKFNLKFMEEAKREKRIEEIYDEIDEIKENMILDIESVDSYEFSKGSVDLDLGEIIGNHLEATRTSIGAGALKSLVRCNEELQESLSVSVEAWRLELEYLDETREIVLVSKNLDVSGGESIVLEVIPEKYVGDIHMVSSVVDEGENIYSVDVSDLEDGNLVYYFDSGFALKEVEKMESVLFGEGASGGNMITGMFIGVGDGLNFGSFFWLPLFLFFGYFGVLIFGKVRLESWKKEPGVEEMVRLINETSLLIREGKVDAARNNYNRMGEIYKCLPVKCRDFFFKEIKRIHLAIDKKDVLGLIKEYEAAKDSFRKDDAMVLHGKINAIYRKLPRKFQEKVFQRLVKREV